MFQTHPAERPDRFMKFTILIVLAALAACSAAPQKQPVVQAIREPQCTPAMEPVPSRDIDSLMQYYDHLSGLSNEALGLEKEKTSLEFSRSGSDLDRMKLALIFWLPDTPFRDRRAALDLLRRGSGAKAMDSFARLMKVMVAEQQDSDNAQQALEQLLAKERKHAEALQNKIDAVKKMEKNLLIHKGNP